MLHMLNVSTNVFLSNQTIERSTYLFIEQPTDSCEKVMNVSKLKKKKLVFSKI